jgi:hypothetical protein
MIAALLLASMLGQAVPDWPAKPAEAWVQAAP